MTQMTFAGKLLPTQTENNRHNTAHKVQRPRRTHKCTQGQSDKYLLLGSSSSSIPRRKLLLSNKHIYSIQSDSPPWPISGTDPNVNTDLRLFHHAVAEHNGKQHTLFIGRRHETPCRANGRFHRDSRTVRTDADSGNRRKTATI